MSDAARTPHARKVRFGPGLLVTAAFIGPGTITTASRAGAEFGYALLWCVAFATAATIVLQEMAARLGLIARRGLAESIAHSISFAPARMAALLLVFSAIVLGNTAYQTGNLIGAGVGVEVLTGLPAAYAAAAFGLIVALVLGFGVSTQTLQRGLMVIVLLMTVALIATAVVSRPSITSALGGFLPRLPESSLLTVLALIGTTIVPYNLFLHASTVQKTWPQAENQARNLRAARLDNLVSIGLGGAITTAIVLAAASTLHGSDAPSSLPKLVAQLGSLIGGTGQLLFACGLAAAGLTSAITAPLAAGYVAAEAFCSRGDQAIKRDRIARATGAAVAGTGALLALGFGASPGVTIIAAQAINGALLPLVAIFLLVTMNSRGLLGEHRNGWKLNLAGAIVFVFTIALGVKLLAKLF